MEQVREVATGPLLSLCDFLLELRLASAPYLASQHPAWPPSCCLSCTWPPEGAFENCTPDLVTFLLYNLQFIIQLSHKICALNSVLVRRLGMRRWTMDGAQSSPQVYGLGLLSPYWIRVTAPKSSGANPASLSSPSSSTPSSQC